jgi:hypothetical protein
MKFEVVASWSVSARMSIEADTLEEAKALALEASIEEEGVYIDDSFQINEEETAKLN